MNKSKRLLELCERVGEDKTNLDKLLEVLRNIEGRRRMLDPSIYQKKNPEKK